MLVCQTLPDGILEDFPIVKHLGRKILDFCRQHGRFFVGKHLGRPMAYETCGLNPRNDCEIHLVGWKIGDFFGEMDGNSKSFISKSFPRWGENIGWLAVGRLGRTILKEADGIQFGQFMGKRICDKL